MIENDPGPEAEHRLLVSEIFGPTIQGEGLSMGVPAVFLRVAGCPLSCVWCDTPYSWDWSRHSRAESTTRITTDQAWAKVCALAEGSGAKTLVITGGEPASQWRSLCVVARSARKHGWRIEVETSGAVDLRDLAEEVDLITVSPKLSSSGLDESTRIKDDLLRCLSRSSGVVWKFVIDTTADLCEVDALVGTYDLAPVFLMSQATTPEQVIERTRWLVPAAIARGYRVTTRLHTLMWGDERGR